MNISTIDKSTDKYNSPAVLERLFPGNEETSELTIECGRTDYSASAIARAVEDCNAHLLNLNVTSDKASQPDGVVVDLRVSHRNSAAVARSLERYGFSVKNVENHVDDPLEMRARLHAMELLHYLEP